jgi:hypothetical protein
MELDETQKELKKKFFVYHLPRALTLHSTGVITTSTPWASLRKLRGQAHD